MTAWTQDEIVERIREVDADGRDMLMGTERADLVEFLDWEHARPFLRTDATEAEWQSAREKESPEDVVRQYLPFAITKADDHRGLSASRSVSHMMAWIWLAGEHLYRQVDWDAYPRYGAPILRKCAELVGFDWEAGTSEEVKRMATGQPCEPGCQQGC